jgi:hypothetical protein
MTILQYLTAIIAQFSMQDRGKKQQICVCDDIAKPYVTDSEH